MEKPDALAFFHGASGYNCAQAVLKAFAEPGNVEPACLERFAHFGGGRAPEGECGALYAARAILQDSTARAAVKEQFVTTLGTTKCREIRKSRAATCAECVQMAADAVHAQLLEGSSLQRPSECAG